MRKRRGGEKPPDPPVDANGVAVLEPERNGVAVADPPSGGPPTPAQSNGEAPAPPAAPRNRPVASFAAMSDRTTRLEVACWARQVKVPDGGEFTQFGLTVGRSWRDKDGVWSDGGSYRVHDVPVLLFLVEQAYHWCLLQRTDVRIASDEPLPF